MKPIDLTPFWGDEDWAGFLLVLVPVGAIPAPGEELRRLVREQIETDAVLYDLVTVALAPPFEPRNDWDIAFADSLIEAAMPDGHFFAPRGVIGVVVVAQKERAFNIAAEDLQGLKSLSMLGARVFGVQFRTGGRTGVNPSVVAIAGKVSRLIELYDQDPRIAMAESTFLGRVNAMIQEGLLRSRVLDSASAEPAAVPTVELEPVAWSGEVPAIAAAPSRPARELEPAARPGLATGPIVARASEPRPTLALPQSTTADTPIAPPAPTVPPRRLLDAVVYDEAEIVVVEQRTAMQRLRLKRRDPSDSAVMDDLRDDGRAVALVYLVFVPDEGVVTRATAKRRTTTAVELARALDSVEFDAGTGRPTQVAVEVLSATNPVQKHGVLRAAGDLNEAVLPRVSIEYFSISEAVEPLLDAARRTTRALDARGIEVVSAHYVFLAAMRFPADDTSEEDWMQLLEVARITWIDFSPPARRPPLYPMPPTPFGLHVLTEKEDVVAVIKKESEVIYRYAAPPEPTPAATTDARGPAETKPEGETPAKVEGPTPPTVAQAKGGKTRRFWPFGKRP